MRGNHLLKTCVSILLGIILLSVTFFGSRLKSPEPSDSVRQKSESSKDAQYDIDYYLTGGKKDIIRIASWYDESYLGNLTSYLSRTFPEIEFEIVYIDKNHYSAIIDTQLSYKGAPDIIYVNRDLAQKHAYTRYIIPLTDICKDFDTEIWDSFAYGNQIYAVPNTTSFECIYYNIDMFEEYGIDIPRDYQEFLDTAMFIDKIKGMKVMSAGLKDYESVSSSALAYLQRSYFETDKGLTFGSRLQYKRASFFGELYKDLKDWQMLIDYKVFRPEMCTMDKQAAIDEFSAGESFLLIAGPEDYNRIKMANKGDNIGTMPLTAPDTGHPLLIGGCSVGFAVNASSRNVDLAKEVVTALASYEGQSEIWKDRVGSRSYRKDLVITNPKEFNGLKEIYDNNYFYQPYSEWGAGNVEINAAFGKQLQKVIIGEETLNMALMKTDIEATKIISEKE